MNAFLLCFVIFVPLFEAKSPVFESHYGDYKSTKGKNTRQSPVAHSSYVDPSLFFRNSAIKKSFENYSPNIDETQLSQKRNARNALNGRNYQITDDNLPYKGTVINNREGQKFSKYQIKQNKKSSIQQKSFKENEFEQKLTGQKNVEQANEEFSDKTLNEGLYDTFNVQGNNSNVDESFSSRGINNDSSISKTETLFGIDFTNVHQIVTNEQISSNKKQSEAHSSEQQIQQVSITEDHNPFLAKSSGVNFDGKSNNKELKSSQSQYQYTIRQQSDSNEGSEQSTQILPNKVSKPVINDTEVDIKTSPVNPNVPVTTINENITSDKNMKESEQNKKKRNFNEYKEEVQKQNVFASLIQQDESQLEDTYDIEDEIWKNEEAYIDDNIFESGGQTDVTTQQTVPSIPSNQDLPSRQFEQDQPSTELNQEATPSQTSQNQSSVQTSQDQHLTMPDLNDNLYEIQTTQAEEPLLILDPKEVSTLINVDESSIKSNKEDKFFIPQKSIQFEPRDLPTIPSNKGQPDEDTLRTEFNQTVNRELQATVDKMPKPQSFLQLVDDQLPLDGDRPQTTRHENQLALQLKQDKVTPQPDQDQLPKQQKTSIQLKSSDLGKPLKTRPKHTHSIKFIKQSETDKHSDIRSNITEDRKKKNRQFYELKRVMKEPDENESIVNKDPSQQNQEQQLKDKPEKFKYQSSQSPSMQSGSNNQYEENNTQLDQNTTEYTKLNLEQSVLNNMDSQTLQDDTIRKQDLLITYRDQEQILAGDDSSIKQQTFNILLPLPGRDKQSAPPDVTLSQAEGLTELDLNPTTQSNQNALTTEEKRNKPPIKDDQESPISNENILINKPDTSVTDSKYMPHTNPDKEEKDKTLNAIYEDDPVTILNQHNYDIPINKSDHPNQNNLSLKSDQFGEKNPAMESTEPAESNTATTKFNQTYMGMQTTSPDDPHKDNLINETDQFTKVIPTTKHTQPEDDIPFTGSDQFTKENASTKYVEFDQDESSAEFFQPSLKNSTIISDQPTKEILATNSDQPGKDNTATEPEKPEQENSSTESHEDFATKPIKGYSEFISKTHDPGNLATKSASFAQDISSTNFDKLTKETAAIKFEQPEGDNAATEFVQTSGILTSKFNQVGQSYPASKSEQPIKDNPAIEFYQATKDNFVIKSDNVLEDYLSSNPDQSGQGKSPTKDGPLPPPKPTATSDPPVETKVTTESDRHAENIPVPDFYQHALMITSESNLFAEAKPEPESVEYGKGNLGTKAKQNGPMLKPHVENHASNLTQATPMTILDQDTTPIQTVQNKSKSKPRQHNNAIILPDLITSVQDTPKTASTLDKTPSKLENPYQDDAEIKSDQNKATTQLDQLTPSTSSGEVMLTAKSEQDNSDKDQLKYELQQDYPATIPIHINLPEDISTTTSDQSRSIIESENNQRICKPQKDNSEEKQQTKYNYEKQTQRINNQDKLNKVETTFPTYQQPDIKKRTLVYDDTLLNKDYEEPRPPSSRSETDSSPRRGRYDLLRNMGNQDVQHAIETEMNYKTLIMADGSRKGSCYCSCDVNSKPVFISFDRL